MFCGKCGKEILEGNAFCTYCGAPINSPETPNESIIEKNIKSIFSKVDKLIDSPDVLNEICESLHISMDLKTVLKDLFINFFSKQLSEIVISNNEYSIEEANILAVYDSDYENYENFKSECDKMHNDAYFNEFTFDENDNCGSQVLSMLHIIAVADMCDYNMRFCDIIEETKTVMKGMANIVPYPTNSAIEFSERICNLLEIYYKHTYAAVIDNLNTGLFVPDEEINTIFTALNGLVNFLEENGGDLELVGNAFKINLLVFCLKFIENIANISVERINVINYFVGDYFEEMTGEELTATNIVSINLSEAFAVNNCEMFDSYFESIPNFLQPFMELDLALSEQELTYSIAAVSIFIFENIRKAIITADKRIDKETVNKSKKFVKKMQEFIS